MAHAEVNVGLDIFLKLHARELMGEDHVSADVEAVVLEGERTVGGREISFTMNNKTHRLATLDNGRVRAQLLFPVLPAPVQKLSASCGGGLSQTVETGMEIVIPGYKQGESVEIPVEDVTSGKRPVRKGEVLTLKKAFYDVSADIKIERGGTLVIRPGCTLEFAEQAGIWCEGVLTAVASEDEKITFSARASSWRNIVFNGRGADRSRMAYCVIKHGAGREREDGLVHGGALQFLYTRDADIALEHLVIRENRAATGYGGAVYVLDSSIAVRHCEILRNRAGQGGGAVYVGGNESADACFDGLEIYRNTCPQDGGGIYLDTVSPYFNDLDMTYNEARFGAGLYHHEVEPGDLHLQNCKIQDNISTAAPDDTDGVSGDWPGN